LRRRAGDAVWREGSDHQVEHLEEGRHEVLVIELKP
jgi:hypothetical protein